MSIVNLQTEPIYVRSPYIIEINEAATLGSKVELYIWNNGTTPPTSPTYTLEKLIPSTTNLLMVYNISNYAREYINFVSNTIVETATPTTPPDTEWAYIKVVRSKLTLSGYTELDTKTYIAFDGFGYYEEGYNPELGRVQLAPGNYEYWYDAANPGSTFPQPFLIDTAKYMLSRSWTMKLYIQVWRTVQRKVLHLARRLLDRYKNSILSSQRIARLETL